MYNYHSWQHVDLTNSEFYDFRKIVYLTDMLQKDIQEREAKLKQQK